MIIHALHWLLSAVFGVCLLVGKLGFCGGGGIDVAGCEGFGGGCGCGHCSGGEVWCGGGFVVKRGMLVGYVVLLCLGERWVSGWIWRGDGGGGGVSDGFH